MKHFICVLVAIATLSLISSQTINYTTTVLSNWACTSGNLQSPIQLSTDKSEFTSRINILNDDYQNIVNSIISLNKENSLVEMKGLADFKAGTDGNYGSINIDYNDYHLKFNLKKVLIKTPGEHPVDGIYPDLELQLYHTKDLAYSPAINNYKRKPSVNEILVITVPYTLKSTVFDAGFIDRVIPSYKASIDSTTTGVNVNISDYNLVKDRSFFFYSGAQTFFPCNENALHLVIREPLFIRQETFTFFKSQVVGALYTSGINTKLALNSYEGRLVYRNFFKSQAEADKILVPLMDQAKTKRDDEAKTLADLEDQKKKDKEAADAEALKLQKEANEAAAQAKIEEIQKNNAAQGGR